MVAADSATAWRATTALHHYCRAIDTHDADALADVLSEDVVLTVGGDTAEGDGDEQSFTGRDTVVRILSSLFEQRQWARHMVSNVLVDIEQDGTVGVRSYFQYVVGRGSDATLGLGDYHAWMREVDGRFVITRLRAAIVEEVTVPRRREAAS